MPDPQTRPTGPSSRATSHSGLVVATRRLRCPQCGSTAVKATSTLQSTAELVVRRRKCRDCDTPFLEISD